MKRILKYIGLVLIVLGCAVAQETYQVSGFPPFAPALPMLEVLEDRGDTVRVRHAYGETEVPKRPKRVFTDTSLLEPMVALGLVPVGSNFLDAPSAPPALRQQLDEAGVVLLERISDLEKIVVLGPDVIVVWELVANNSNPQQLYEQLSDIAPTLVLNANPYSYWRETMRDLGEVFAADAGGALAGFDEATAVHCEKIRAVIGDESVSIVSVMESDIRLMGVGYETPEGFTPAAPTVWAYGVCGLTPATEIKGLVGTEFAQIISLELLPEITAEHLFLMGLSDAEAATVTEHPLWSRVAAQRAGQVYRIPVLSAFGPATTLWALEQAANAVTGERE